MARCQKGQNSPDEAVAGCTAVIRSGRLKGAQLASVHNYYALALLGKGDLDGAIANYDRAISLDPSKAVFYSNRAGSWNRKGQYDRAIADADSALRLDPRYVSAFLFRASAWDNKGSYDRALADYDAAIRLEPRQASYYARRSNTVRLKGDVDRALADAELAIRLDPNLSNGYNNRALAWKMKGDFDRAIADYDQAIRLAPTDGVLFANRANAWRLKGDLDRAMADVEQAIRFNPKLAYAHNTRGLIWSAKGDVERAIVDYSEAIRLAPKLAIYHSNRGILLRRKGDMDRAIADFDQALRVDPTHVVSYTSRGLAFEAKGDRERARGDFNAALAAPATDEFSRKSQATARTRLAVLAGEPASTTAVSSPVFKSGVESRSRVALVIGNGAYVSGGNLPNPVNDARAVAAALREIGFDVLEGTDLDRTSQERTVRDFLRKAATARVALFYYAGHGMQVDGKNYLVPVDAKISAPSDLAFETIELDKILSGLDDETRTNIVILDACRDNPLSRSLAGRSRSTAGTGLATVSSVSSGMLIAYATAPDKVALDGVRGANSPFTSSFLKHLRTPGLEIRQLMTRVRADVVAATKKAQVPWDNSSLVGDVYLTGGPKS